MKRFTLAAAATAISATAVFAAVDVGSLDTDSDNFVSKAELMAAYPDFDDSSFDDIDTNDDSRLSADELNAPEASGLFAQGSAIVQDTDLTGLDTDNDLFLTYDELAVAYPNFDETFFDDIDTNDDSRLSADEMNAPGAPNLFAQGMASGQDVDLMALDTDNDSFLTYDELAVAYPDFPETQFVNIDRNGDSRLDNNEFTAPETQTELRSY